MRDAERFVVTGALGCIGAWTVKLLADAGTDVVATDLASNPARWRLLDATLERRVPLVACDVTDRAAFERLLPRRGVPHLLPPAPPPVPVVRAGPTPGARVDGQGHAGLPEAARDRPE